MKKSNLGAAVLVLLVVVVYEVHPSDDLDYIIYIPSLVRIGSGIRLILMVLPQQFQML